MSIAQVVTLGFGTFGSVNKLPTIGFSIAAQSIIVQRICRDTFIQTRLERELTI